MAQVGEIQPGDWVTNTKQYPNLDYLFKCGPLEVLRIQQNNLDYAGNAFVFVELRRGKEIGLYICAIEKYNS